MDNVEFDGNTALDNAGASALAWQISDQTLYVTNCVFQGQTSTDPYEAQVTAAIFGGNASLVMDSTIFNSNMGHLELYGGESSSFTIKNSTLQGGSAAADGGAIKIYGTYVADIDSCIFNGNGSTMKGGGIALFDDGEITISNSTFTVHTADRGGAIYVEDASLTLTNVDITNNASVDGGYGGGGLLVCLLYTSPSPRDRSLSRMPSSA